MRFSLISPRVRRLAMRACGLTALVLPALLMPSAAGAFDADNDSISDEADAFPCNAGSASVAFAPGQNSHGMLLIEDQWPSMGDDDFNDAVVAYNYLFELDALGKVRSIRANYNLLAIGGLFDNGMGLRLPGIAANAVSAARLTVAGQATTTLHAQSSDPANLTLRLLPNLRALYANQAGTINSDPALATQTQGLAMELEIQFATPQTLDIGQAPFDVYIYRTTQTGHEIHQPQFPGTAEMDNSLFNSQDDASTGSRHYVDHRGLPFILNLPGLRPWAQEGVSIDHLYPNIVTFASSGGTQARDFYDNGVDLSFAYGWTPPESGMDVGVGGWSSPVSAAFVRTNSIPADTSCINAWGLSVEFGTTRDTYGYASAMDASGNVVIVGYTTASFTGFANAGGQDLFVAKYNRQTGVQVWAQQLGGTGNDAARSVAVDAAGNIFVVGETRSSFGQQTNAGQSDAFLLKYNAAGALQWTRFLGASGYDYARGVAVDSTGAVFVGGGTTSGALPGATYSGNTPASFLAKYDTSGNRLWTQQYRTDGAHASNHNYTSALAVDSTGAVYAVGSEHRYNRSNDAASSQFIAKHDGATGATTWVQHIGDYGYYNGSSDYRFANAFGVATTASNDVYVVGHWEAGASVSSWNGWNRAAGDTSADITLVKFNAAGEQQWVQSVASSDRRADYGLAITTDPAGNAYPVGYTAGALPGQTAGGNFDYFAGRFDPSGSRQWLVQHNTASDDGAFGVAVDTSQSALYVVGNTGSISGTPVAFAGQYYGFIARHNLNTGAMDLFNLTVRAQGVGTSCKTILQSGAGTTSGVYTIDPDGTAGPIAPFDVYCDMTSDSGGWTLVLRGLGGTTAYQDWWTTADLNLGNSRSIGASFKFSDAKIAAIRGTSGIYRLLGDGSGAGQKRFVNASCNYGHLTPAENSGCNVTWTNEACTTGRAQGTAYGYLDGISDYPYGPFVTHDAYPSHIWWVNVGSGDGHGYNTGRNITMWVR